MVKRWVGVTIGVGFFAAAIGLFVAALTTVPTGFAVLAWAGGAICGGLGLVVTVIVVGRYDREGSSKCLGCGRRLSLLADRCPTCGMRQI